jgi:hypothetical protein
MNRSLGCPYPVRCERKSIEFECGFQDATARLPCCRAIRKLARKGVTTRSTQSEKRHQVTAFSQLLTRNPQFQLAPPLDSSIVNLLRFSF